MLGLAIYMSYGYTRSAVGQKMGRPKTDAGRTEAGCRYCFILVAVGLFVIPPTIVAPRELFSEAFDRERREA
jgi:hypothetical protein